MELVLPDRRYDASYREAIAEYRRQQLNTDVFLGASEDDAYARFEDYRLGRDLPPRYVKATHLWLVEGDRFLGEVSIRHELTDALLRFGGHIGYGVRYTEWNRGIGTAMLALALRYAREQLGLTRVLVTCNDENIGSARVIEKNGGVLWDRLFQQIDGVKRVTRRYWIPLSDESRFCRKPAGVSLQG